MECRTSERIKYDYYISDNIIYLVIEKLENVFGGGGYTTYKGYYYDIDNNKELSVEDICNKYNINVDDVNNEIKTSRLNNDMGQALDHINNLNEIVALNPISSKLNVYVQLSPTTEILTLEKNN